jgi:Protein of unknown function (DUF2897)
MFRTLMIIAVVLAVVIGGLLTLRSSARTGMPSEEVLKRAAQRGREQAAKDEAEKEN